MRTKVGIWGMGESGVGAALLAQQLGYEPYLVAHQPPAPKYAHLLQERGIPWQVREDPLPVLEQAAWVVRSPGIPLTAAPLLSLKAQGIPVFSDLEWGWRHFPTSARLILVTGSAGKSSTVRWIQHLLQTAGKRAIACGNIGYSFCAALAEGGDYEYYVLEASSFQLADTYTLLPHIAVVTGLVPNHLDWHGSFQSYAHAKLHFVERLLPGSHLVYDADSVLLEKTLRDYSIRAQIWRYAFEPREGVCAWIENNNLICDMATNTDSERWEVSYESTPVEELTQRKNSLAAAIVGRLEGLRREDLRRSFQTLEKMPHRLEQVDTVQGVLYVNDSKATTTDAVWYAMQSFTRPIIWIAGGVDKGNDWGQLVDTVRTRVKALILIGNQPDSLYQAFKDIVPWIERVYSMEEAVRKAHEMAQPEDVVLLSPACASFDWFSGYEERGEAFRSAVRKLKAERNA